MASRSTPLATSSTLLMTLVLSACGGGGGGAETPAPPPVATPAPLSISAQPTDQSVTSADVARFALVAAGDGLSYQWQLSTDGGLTWTNLAGATSATLEVLSPTPAQSGHQYRALISGASGNSATSATVTLRVAAAAAPPSIVSQPVGVTVTAGAPANFRVEATGTGEISYQWQRNDVNISGANAATYSLASPTAADTGAVFRAVVTNAAGSVTSSHAALTVAESVAAPTITAQPQSLNGTDGGPILLSVTAEGTGPFAYQWRKNGVDIPGATSSIFAAAEVTRADNGAVYAVVVSNGGGTVTSTNATLTVNYLPADWLAQPLPASVTQGQTALFVAAAFGSQPMSYQWFRNGVAIAGATGLTYTTPATTLADDGAQYTVAATNPANTITSTVARLSVLGAAVAPSISAAPANASITEGQTATFTAAASGTGTLAYQWLRNGAPIAGATAGTYTTSAATTADSGARYAVRVTNTAGSVTSAEALLTVQAATGGLVGRFWALGQILDQTDGEVRDRERVIDDSGRVTVMYMQNNGSRQQLFATRGVPNAAGTAPTWSTPVALDVLGGNAVFSGSYYSYFWGLSGSPNGNAVAYWTFNGPCTPTTYRTRAGTCQFVYTARFLASAGAWEAPLVAGSFPGDPGSVQINDRGDIAFAVTGGTPATNYPYYTETRTVVWRAAADTSFKTANLSGPIAKFALAMDNSGNMLVGAQLTQDATSDAAAYRGTLAAGFGAAQVLDTRGAAVSSVTPTVGTGGQQLVTWIQNNGTRSSVYAATSANATAAMTVQDMGITGWANIFALDNGQILLAETGNQRRYRWTAGSWSAAETLPTWRLSTSNTCAVARNGDGVCVNGNGLWVTYDAVRNVAVQRASTASPGTGYVLGFSKSMDYGRPILSTSGVAFTDSLSKFDTLPTFAVPAGDGRNVVNLWGLFLK